MMKQPMKGDIKQTKKSSEGTVNISNSHYIFKYTSAHLLNVIYLLYVINIDC